MAVSALGFSSACDFHAFSLSYVVSFLLKQLFCCLAVKCFSLTGREKCLFDKNGPGNGRDEPLLAFLGKAPVLL